MGAARPTCINTLLLEPEWPMNDTETLSFSGSNTAHPFSHKDTWVKHRVTKMKNEISDILISREKRIIAVAAVSCEGA